MVDKPQQMFAIVARAIRGEGTPGVAGLSFNPFKLVALFIALPGLLAVGAAGASFRPVIIAMLLLLALSAIPGLLFYPVVQTMMGMFETIALACYLTVGELLAAAAPRRRVGATL